MSIEKSGEVNSSKAEHFDDFEAMDIAVRGLARVLADKPKPDAVSGEEIGLAKEDKIEDGFARIAGLEGAEEDYENDYDENYEYEDGGDERLEELEREKQFEVMTIPQEILEEYKLPKGLPAGVAVMGGTARSLARRMVTGDKEPVRDLDLVYIAELADPENPTSQEILDEVSEKYMPDDFAYGHGIQREKLENYFGSRDFTMNQCLVVGDKLLMTRAAYDDFQENIIRPSYYSQPEIDQPVGDRLLMKALLLKAVLEECTSSYPTIEDLEDARYAEYTDGELYGVQDFQIALVLNKAMGRGVRTAMHFTETLVDYNIVDEKYIDQPLRLARDLMANGEIYFEFRPVDAELDDGWEEDFEVKPLSPVDTNTQKELKRYKSKEVKHWTEPISGQYTKADYERVNSVA